MRNALWAVLTLLAMARPAWPFSSNNVTVTRVVQPSSALVGECAAVSVIVQNHGAAPLRGFVFSEAVPNGVSVETVRVSINGVDVPDFVMETDSPGTVFVGLTSSRWVLETPPAFPEANSLPPGGTLGIQYCARSAVAGSFALDNFSWVGSYVGGTGPAFGYSETADRATVTFASPVPDIAVTDTVAPAGDRQVGFGAVTVALTSDQTVTVTNAGTAKLILGTVAQANPLVAPFSVATDGCSGRTLESGGTCAVVVRFSPSTAAAASDSFSIVSNDPDEGTVAVSVTGTGTAALVPDIAVTDTVAPAGDRQVDFGAVTVGQASEQTVTVTNAGTANLILGTVGQANPLAAPFAVATDGCSGRTLAPGGTCALVVRFSPSTVPAASDSFSIVSDDPDSGTVTMSVSGTGTAVPIPDISVTDSVAPAGDLQVGFGAVTVGLTSDQTVTVRNEGTANLILGTVGQANPLVAPFSVATDGCSGRTLASGGTCALVVRFSPSTASACSDSFGIVSNDPDEGTVTVSVSGTGTEPVSRLDIDRKIQEVRAGTATADEVKALIQMYFEGR